MLGRLHILLLLVAVLFSENIRSAVSFTIPKATILLPSNLFLYSQTSSRSTTELSLSVEIEEDDFFSKASQSAAQERMQQLQDGESPLAVSLSTTTIVSSSDDTDSDVKIPNEPQLSSSSSTKDNKKDEPIDIKVPIEPQLPREPPTIQQVVQQIDSTQIIDDAEMLPPTIITEGMTAEEAELVRKARLGDDVLLQEEEGETETPLAPVDEATQSQQTAEQTQTTKKEEDEEPTAEEAEEKRNARLDAADKVAQTLLKEEFPIVDDNDVTVKDDTEEDGDDRNTNSLYEEMIKVPIDPFQEKKSTSDEVENTEEKKPREPDDTKPATDDDSTSTDEPISSSSSSSPPDSNGSKKLLSSDGKELYEPSQSALEMNQENVDMGLLVLTRAMLQLKAIVDKESS